MYTAMTRINNDNYQNNFVTIDRWKKYCIDTPMPKWSVLIETETGNPIMIFENTKFLDPQTDSAYVFLNLIISKIRIDPCL